MSKIIKNTKFNKNLTDDQALEEAKPIVDGPASNGNSSVDDNSKASAGDFSYSPKKVDGHGSSIKQEVIAKAISGNGASGSSGASIPLGSSMRSIPYSGTDARIIDNASGSPAFNKSDRSDSRYGQKTDNTARHINNVPSETYIVEIDGPVPLSESADKVQGSLAHPANEFARIQKCSEAFPGAVNFERSIDELTDDILLDTTGHQVTYQGVGESYNDIDPTKTFDSDIQEDVEYSLHRSNYVPRTLHVAYDEKGQLKDFYYNEDKFDTVVTGDLQAERASTHTITAANRAEIDRQAMGLKAGDEMKDNWSPIPFTYTQPTRDVLYLSTIEKQLGAQVVVPIKMSAKAHSYALNKASKDGLRPVSGGAEICLGPVAVYNRSTAYDNFSFGRDTDEDSVFNRKFTSRGAPSAIIKMNDSVAKYHDRADVLTQPRSFNMILKRAMSNYGTFKIDPEVANVFDNINVFSTIGRSYDPSAPVNITDTIGLQNAYSLNELGSCFRRASVSRLDEYNLNTAGMNAFYANQVTGISIGDMDGFAVAPSYFIDMDGGHIEDYVFTDEDYAILTKRIRRFAAKTRGYQMFNGRYIIPVLRAVTETDDKEDHVILFCFNFTDDLLDTGTHPTLIIRYGSSSENTSANEESYDMFTTDIYNDYLTVNYHNRQNYYTIQLRDPYTDGIKTWLRQNYGLVSKVTEDNALAWPVHYSTKSFSAYSYLVMMSLKFIQEQRSKAMYDVLKYERDFEYPFSDVINCDSIPALGGSQYGQTDIFELLSVREMKPAIALRWTHPELYTKLEAAAGHYRTLMPFYMNEESYDFSHPNSSYKLELNYDRAAMSYPLTKHGVRWSYSDDIYGLSERDLRLVQDQIIAPPSFNGADSAIYDDMVEVYKYSQATDGLIIVPSDVTQLSLCSTARELGYLTPVVGGYLFPEPQCINHADPTSPRDFVFSERCNCTASIVGHSAFRAYCWVIQDGNPTQNILATGSSVISRAANFTQKYYVFSTSNVNDSLELGICLSTSALVNDAASGGIANVSQFTPFTNGVFNRGAQAVQDHYALFTYAKALWARIQKLPFAYNPFDFSGTVTTDPYSFNYLFGLLGFRASDYKEDLYNRLQKRMSDGWKFISDPFVEDSLLVKA